MDKIEKIGVITSLTQIQDTSKDGVRYKNNKVRISAQFDFDPGTWYSSMTTHGIASRLKKGERVRVTVWEQNGWKNFDVVFGDNTPQPAPTQGPDIELIKSHIGNLNARVTKLEQMIQSNDIQTM